MLSSEDKKKLDQVYKLFRQLEKNLDAKGLAELKSALSELNQSPSQDVQRIAQLENHLRLDLTPKQLFTFLVPLERLLQKNIQDDDFLVTQKDLAEKPSEALPLVFVLHNLRSAFNVGSIFRTAECLHAEKIYLCGYTPSPEQSKVLKTALGTQENMAWVESTSILETLQSLKKQGYRLVALETAQKAVSLYEDFPSQPTAFVVGNERFGLDLDVLQNVDEVRYIPLRGQKNSLNVGVSLAIAGFEWNRQWQS